MGPLLVDAHVHFHPCFGEEQFLDRAAANVAEASRVSGFPVHTSGCLLLSETSDACWFGRLQGLAQDTKECLGDWRLEATSEPESLLATKADGGMLILIAGRQIATRERLEVLALGTTAKIQDGMTLRETISAALHEEAITVIPWGFGKWWGGRGKLLAGFLEEVHSGRVHLGDNGGRPHWTVEPWPLRSSIKRGLWILPGSDPLPMIDEVERVGSYGFRIDEYISRSRPAADLKRYLRSLEKGPSPYGKRVGWLRFIRNQTHLRLVRRQL